ncbi:MAG: HlyC/CorC family transporter [Austwickia sp.]|nr:HlyC/CorC family transporter [Austwickia sp.]MBK9101877.1 HlyC/CorC family transporter [Austwickia sp.]
MTLTLGILTVLLLTAMTGFFVAVEFTYVAIDRSSLADLADQGDAKARRAMRVTERLSFVLSGAQLGITVTALLVGYVSEPLIGGGLADLLGWSGLSEAARLSLGFLLALVFSTVVQMVFGELAPKNLSIARSLPLARHLARPTLLYMAVAGPVIRFFDDASNRILRAVGIEPVEELPSGATPEDLERIIDVASEHGALDEEVSELLERGLAFRERTVREVMTPRVDTIALSPDDSVADLVGVTASGHARFPVLAADGEEVLGVLGPAAILTVPPRERATTPLSALLGTPQADPVVVPDTLSLPRALEHLRTSRRQLAVVIDEYGGFAGVISFEDIAEEVVGDILDEDDHQPRESGVPAPVGPDGSIRVPGRLRLDELEARYDVDLPEDGDFETISGLVLDRLGRVARVGDLIRVPVIPDSRREPTDQESASSVAVIRVDEVRRHVPLAVTITFEPASAGSGEASEPAAEAPEAGDLPDRGPA